MSKLTIFGLPQDAIFKGLFQYGESKNSGLEYLGSIITARAPKLLKWVKFSKSLFRDFLIDINQIDHEESKNFSPETKRSFLRAPRPKATLIKSKFQVHYFVIS